jgi:hypothetical protein
MTNAWLGIDIGTPLMTALLTGTTYTGPTDLYLGLATGPNSTDEISGGSYTRQVVTFGTITTSGVTAYANTTVDAAFTGLPTATLTHFQLWDNSSGGSFQFTTVIYVSGSPGSISVLGGESLVVPSGSWRVGFTGKS